MSIDVRLKDGTGNGFTAKVDEEGQLHAIVHPHPPTGEQLPALPFRQYFTDDGLSTGSNDMLVDGSSTNVEFSIAAHPTKDIHVKTISILIADGTAALNEFGAITALTNGVEFKWTSQEVGDVIIHEGLKSNFDFVRLAIGEPSFGNTTDAFRARNASGASEGYIPVIDLADVFGLPYGIRLRAGSTDRLVFTIRDNVSSIDDFNIIGYGLTI